MAHDGFNRLANDIPNRIGTAFDPLLIARHYSEQLGSDHWEFAVEIDQLTAIGLTPNDFRWLVRRELVEHRREVTLDGDDGRAFRATGDLTYCDRSCFVLTDLGVSIATQFQQATMVARSDASNHNGPVEHLLDVPGRPNSNGKCTAVVCIPHWDAERRELKVNGTLVKHYKWAAENQQKVLCAFEEEGWPPRIDDPLSPHEELDSKRRLADTIKCLNRKQCNSIVHFRGDGTGEGIIWELC